MFRFYKVYNQFFISVKHRGVWWEAEHCTEWASAARRVPADSICQYFWMDPSTDLLQYILRFNLQISEVFASIIYCTGLGNHEIAIES